MYNTCLRIVNDTAEAEDIMQESFLDAFQRIESYTGEGSFGSWLKRIVVNRSLDYLRKQKDIISLEEAAIDLPDQVEESREEELQLQVAGVKKAIFQLPDEYRIVLSLFLLEGYDHEEIAQILHISNQLSRTRYSRARQKLLVILKENSLMNAFSAN
jgi:RNA polymerase sigma-70 factor (ECF subfamily)